MTIQEQILNQINKLSLSERLLIVESIWDSILSAKENISVTEEQKSELDKRYREYKNDPEDSSDWETVKKRIQSRLWNMK